MWLIGRKEVVAPGPFCCHIESAWRIVVSPSAAFRYSNMEHNLRQLSEHLSQASTILTSVFTSAGVPSENISRSNTNARQPSLASWGIAAAAIGTNISGAVARARSMMTHLASHGVYSRPNQRERLTASTSSSAIPHRNKRQRKEVETKAFEFVLMNIPSENESWAIAEEHIELRGLIEITTTSKEKKFARQLARQRGKSIPWLVMGISNSCEQPEGSCRNLSVVKRLIINN